MPSKCNGALPDTAASVGKNRSIRRKTSQCRVENKLNSHMTPDLRIEPGPHWWEASALTTVPSNVASIAIVANVASSKCRRRSKHSKSSSKRSKCIKCSKSNVANVERISGVANVV